MAVAGRDMGDARRRGVATVGKHEVPGRNRKLPERLPLPLAGVIRKWSQTSAGKATL